MERERGGTSGGAGVGGAAGGTGGTAGGSGTGGTGGTGGVSGTGGTGGTAGAAGSPGCDDADGDGYGTGASCLGLDCAPDDATVHPGAEEVCNGVDDDCNNATDDGITCKPRLWVYVLAGQSNMVGLGFNSELPINEQGAVDGAYIYYNDSVHPNTNTLQWMQLAPGFGVYEDRFGPELTFGRRLRELRPDQTIAIIKVAEGGTALHDRWAAGVGDLYQLLINEVTTQLQALEADWQPQVAGFVWMQGESDATNDAWAAAYQTNFAQFLYQYRTDISLPIVATTAGLIRPSTLWPYSATVRNATTVISENIGQVSVVDTQDLDTQVSDPAHYTSESFIELGRRFADSMDAQLPTEWHFQTDLGAAQGDGFWTCRSRSAGTVELLTWDAAQSWWSNPDGTVLVGKGFMHPSATSDAELGWWAPFAGKISVAVDVADGDVGGGDGVHVEVIQAGQTVWTAELNNGGAAQTSFQADVVQGQELLFRTSCGSAQNPLYDSTAWQIDITMTTVAP